MAQQFKAHAVLGFQQPHQAPTIHSYTRRQTHALLTLQVPVLTSIYSQLHIYTLNLK